MQREPVAESLPLYRSPTRGAPVSVEASPHAALMRLQREAGNRATAFVVARLRAEDEDAFGPIEAEADTRSPAPGIGPAPSPDEEPAVQTMVQRHRVRTDVIGPPPAGEREVGGSIGAGSGHAAQREGEEAEKVTYPSYTDMSTDGDVDTAASTAWKETKEATSDGSRREQGFWVRWNKDTKDMSAANHVVASPVDNDTTASVDIGAKPADTTENFTVGSFHTHTPTRYREVGRPIGPSTADGNADRSDNVAGLVYDYTSPDGSGNIPKKHPINSASKLWHSGPTRRT